MVYQQQEVWCTIASPVQSIQQPKPQSPYLRYQAGLDKLPPAEASTIQEVGERDESTPFRQAFSWIMNMDDARGLAIALEEAQISYDEGGIPVRESLMTTSPQEPSNQCRRNHN
jgi:hypothetical protein